MWMVEDLQGPWKPYYVGLVECMFAKGDRNEGDLDAAENRIPLGCPPTQRLRT